MSNRKRRAPGASPRVPQQPGIPASMFPQDTTMATDGFAHNWTDAAAGGDLDNVFGDSTFYDYGGSLGAAGGQPSGHSRIVSLDGITDMSAADADAGVGQLVRRNPNQQLAARRSIPWPSYNSTEQHGDFHNAVEDDDRELEQKAMLARKDAQSKRKQIPPFVQKLSSFLDDNKNTNLIRWSDDGNSFIVIDEDEFARTLIPELFKHNNYASFVRQLNMYGFHKKVGLSDNSMKASEMKAKAPSEYYNKYFKRGRPELLWLIQKPKNTASGPKRKRDEDGGKGDSDEDRKYVPDAGGGGHYAEDLAVRGNQDMAMIPRTEYNSLRNEVRALQQQQKMISNVINNIRRQNDELYQQATTFRQLHDRHENSINAILTFLATFYDRSIQNGGASNLNLAELFHPMTNQQPHGNVVDVDDFPEKNFEKPANQMQMQRPQKRSTLLLPAPAAKDAATKIGRAATLSPAILSSAGSPMSNHGSRPAAVQPQSSRTTHSRSTSNSTNFGSNSATAGPSHAQPTVELPPTPQTPQSAQNLPEHSEIMSAIHSANANTSSNPTTQAPHFDLPAALANYTSQRGQGPLTPEQRNDALMSMAAASSNSNTNSAPNNFDIHNTNNAMVNPHPPAMPDLTPFVENQEQLNLLQRMSEDTNSRVQSLQSRLQPLSPSGSIPGLGSDGYFGAAAGMGGMGGLGEPGQYDLDLDSFVNGDDFVFNSTGTGQDGMTATAGATTDSLPEINFDLPDHNVPVDGMNGAGFTNGVHHGNDDDLLGFDGANDENRVESLSSTATSPAVTVEDADDEEAGMDPSRPGRPSPKRRKV